MDVRFPNGAQCTFGGYGASFIELFVLSALLVYVALMCPIALHAASESNPRLTGSVCVAVPLRTIKSIAIRIETERGARMPSLERTTSPSSVSVARNTLSGYWAFSASSDSHRLQSIAPAVSIPVSLSGQRHHI